MKELIDKIITELYETNFVQQYTHEKLLSQADYDDYLGQVWLAIIEWIHRNEEKTIELYKEGGINSVRKVCSGIICRTCRSVTSPAYVLITKKNIKNIQIKRDNDPKEYWDEENGYRG